MLEKIGKKESSNESNEKRPKSTIYTPQPYEKVKLFDSVVLVSEWDVFISKILPALVVKWVLAPLVTWAQFYHTLFCRLVTSYCPVITNIFYFPYSLITDRIQYYVYVSLDRSRIRNQRFV